MIINGWLPEGWNAVAFDCLDLFEPYPKEFGFIVLAGKEISELGAFPTLKNGRTTGNIAVKVRSSIPGGFLVTGSGTDKRRLGESDIVLVTRIDPRLKHIHFLRSKGSTAKPSTDSLLVEKNSSIYSIHFHLPVDTINEIKLRYPVVKPTERVRFSTFVGSLSQELGIRKAVAINMIGHTATSDEEFERAVDPDSAIVTGIDPDATLELAKKLIKQSPFARR